MAFGKNKSTPKSELTDVEQLRAEIARHRAAIAELGEVNAAVSPLREEGARLHGRAAAPGIELPELEQINERLLVLDRELEEASRVAPMRRRMRTLHAQELEAAQNRLLGAATLAYEAATEPRYERIAALLKEALAEVSAIEGARRETLALHGTAPVDQRGNLGNELLNVLSKATVGRDGSKAVSPQLLHAQLSA